MLDILLTTHSDTLVLEINNLIMLSNEFDDKDSFMKTHKYQQAHIINPVLTRHMNRYLSSKYLKIN
jgi:hypothetical protein